MRRIYCMLAFAGALVAAEAATFTGVVTDTMCGAKPHTMMKGHTAAECVRMCVKGPHEYALFDGTKVMKLSNQKAAAKYAAQKVEVTGTYNEKNNTIKTVSIESSGSK